VVFILKQERLLVHYEEQHLARFTVLEASEPMKTTVPSVPCFPEYSSAYACQHGSKYKGDFIENGIESRMYEGFPSLKMQFSTNS